MNLDTTLEAIISYLPTPPPYLVYTGSVDTYKGIPGIYVALSHEEYTLFGSFIPFADVYFLLNPVTPGEEGIYYEFTDNVVTPIKMKSEDIKEQVTETISELSQTFQAFIDIFVPLVGDTSD